MSALNEIRAVFADYEFPCVNSYILPCDDSNSSPESEVDIDVNGKKVKLNYGYENNTNSLVQDHLIVTIKLEDGLSCEILYKNGIVDGYVYCIGWRGHFRPVCEALSIETSFAGYMKHDGFKFIHLHTVWVMLHRNRRRIAGNIKKSLIEAHKRDFKSNLGFRLSYFGPFVDDVHFYEGLIEFTSPINDQLGCSGDSFKFGNPYNSQRSWFEMPLYINETRHKKLVEIAHKYNLPFVNP